MTFDLSKLMHAGRNIEIFDPVSFIDPSKIYLSSYNRISEFTLIAGGKGTYLGNFIHLANHVSIIGGGICILEDFVGVCAGARIITGTDDISGKGIPSPLVPEKYRSFYRSYIICRKHSFVGTNVVIHPGVEIGEGVVVGSGSIVTKNLEAWGIYLGSPAKRVKDRPKDKILTMEKEVYQKLDIKMTDFTHIKYK